MCAYIISATQYAIMRWVRGTLLTVLVALVCAYAKAIWVLVDVYVRWLLVFSVLLCGYTEGKP